MTLHSEMKHEKLMTETSHIINVSPFISQLDTYDFGEYIVSKVTLDNLQIDIEFYPKGTHKSQADWCSLFAIITNGKGNDTRKLKCRIGLDNSDGFLKEMLDIVHSSWRRGIGHNSLIDITTLKQNPRLIITLTLYHDPSFILTTEDRFENQLLEMYKLSRDNGDITLSITTKDNHQHSDDTLYVPPSKKQKIEHDTKTNDTSNTHTMKCSSIILQSGSRVFNRMLKNHMLENKEKKITIFAQSVQDVDDMIYFMATNTLRQTANVMNIIDLAHFYGMERLEMACLNRMLKQLSVATFVDVVTIFDRFGIKHGYNTLVKFGKKNLNQIRGASNFSDLSHSFKCIVFGLAKD
eukprot:91941_1